MSGELARLREETDPAEVVMSAVAKGRVGPYQSRVLAQEILAQLEEEDPRALTAWLRSEAENMLWSLVNQMDRRDRGLARRTSARSVFAAMANSPASQRHQAVTAWLTTHYATEDGLRRELGSLRKKDLQYVANGYRSRASANQLQAAFMDALSRRVGRGTVADHFDEDSLAQLYQSCLEFE